MTYISDVIMLITMLFMAVGAVDKICGNKLGYGKEFEAGINATGPLILAAAAIMAIAPSLSQILIDFVGPFFKAINVDPSLFPAMLLCSDMGGYALATELAGNEALGLYNGLVVAGIMGATFTFVMPLALLMLDKSDLEIIVAGVLTGITAIPFGCFLGGLTMMLTPYPIGIVDLLKNTMPVVVMSVMIVLCLKYLPAFSIRIFGLLGTGISALVVALTAIAIFQQVMGVRLPFFDKMAIADSVTGLTGFDNGLLTCGKIGIVLSGAFPMVLWISRVCKKPLSKLAIVLNISESSVTGLLSSATNYAAGFGCFKDMDTRGKYLNMSFVVPAGCVLGDLLGFTAGINSDILLPMIIGKLSAGIIALLLAYKMAPKLFPE